MLEWVAIPFSGDLLHPGIESRSPTLQTFCTTEPPEKSMDYQSSFLAAGWNSAWFQLIFAPSPSKKPTLVSFNMPQYSCLENPLDRGAWRAAVHRVAQNRTRLKRLSSSSSLSFNGPDFSRGHLRRLLRIPWSNRRAGVCTWEPLVLAALLQVVSESLLLAQQLPCRVSWVFELFWRDYFSRWARKPAGVQAGPTWKLDWVRGQPGSDWETRPGSGPP